MKMRAILGAAALIGAVSVASAPVRHVRAATTINFWIRSSDSGFVTPLAVCRREAGSPSRAWWYSRKHE